MENRLYAHYICIYSFNGLTLRAALVVHYLNKTHVRKQKEEGKKKLKTQKKNIKWKSTSDITWWIGPPGFGHRNFRKRHRNECDNNNNKVILLSLFCVNMSWCVHEYTEETNSSLLFISLLRLDAIFVFSFRSHVVDLYVTKKTLLAKMKWK